MWRTVHVMHIQVNRNVHTIVLFSCAELWSVCFMGSGHFIKQWRKHRDLTQEQVTEAIDMSRTNYLKIENGRIPYSQSVLESLATVMRCRPADLISRDPNTTTKLDIIYSKLASMPQSQRDFVIEVVEKLLH